MRLKLLFSTVFLAVVAPSFLLAAEGKTEPATLGEIYRAIEWDKVPQLPGAENARHGLTTSTYKAPGTFPEAAEFYRKSLTALGWVEDKTPIPGLDPNAYLSLSFDKKEMRLNVSGYRSEPKDPMSLTLFLSGNVDVRSIPKPADAKVASNYRTAVFYSTGAKPEEAAEFSRKAIVEMGWKEQKDDSAAFHAKEGRFVAKYVKNAMELTVVAFKGPKGDTQVTRSVGVRNTFDPKDIRGALDIKEAPVPAKYKDYLDVLDLRNFPKMDGAKKRERPSRMFTDSCTSAYSVPGKIGDVEKFYRKQFGDKGWALRDVDKDMPDQLVMKFEMQGYLVEVGASLPADKSENEVVVAIINHGNFDIRLLPYPTGAEITFAREAFVNCSTTLSVPETRSFYSKELEKLGWKEAKSGGQGTMEFNQNAARLKLEIVQGDSGGSQIKVRAHLLPVE